MAHLRLDLRHVYCSQQWRQRHYLGDTWIMDMDSMDMDTRITHGHGHGVAWHGDNNTVTLYTTATDYSTSCHGKGMDMGIHGHGP